MDADGESQHRAGTFQLVMAVRPLQLVHGVCLMGILILGDKIVDGGYQPYSSEKAASIIDVATRSE